MENDSGGLKTDRDSGELQMENYSRNSGGLEMKNVSSGR